MPSMGCVRVFDREDVWGDHMKVPILEDHLDQMELSMRYKEGAYDFYEATIQHGVPSMVPSAGCSIA